METFEIEVRTFKETMFCVLFVMECEIDDGDIGVEDIIKLDETGVVKLLATEIIEESVKK